MGERSLELTAGRWCDLSLLALSEDNGLLHETRGRLDRLLGKSNSAIWCLSQWE